MAYTLSTIAGQVRSRIRDTSYDPTLTTDAINDTINDVFNEYTLPFMQTTQTYTLTAGTSDITNGSGLPDNYVQAIDLIVTSTGLEMVLPYRETSISDGTNPDQDDQAANTPQYWYKYGDTIRIYPKPAAAYTVTLRYYKKPTELSADSDVPEIPSEFKELIVVGAAYRIMQIKDNYDQAGILQNKYDEILQKMVVRYTQVQTGQPFIMPVNVVTTTGNF